MTNYTLVIVTANRKMRSSESMDETWGVINMSDTALIPAHFTIDASIPEWLEQKRTTRSGSPKTITAYSETMHQFRAYLAQFGLDLLGNPIDIARVAPLWASTR